VSTTGYSDISTLGLPTRSLSQQDLLKFYAPWGDKDLQSLDDKLHTDDPVNDAIAQRQFTLWNIRGLVNAFGTFFVLAGVLTLFTAYPLLSHYLAPKPIIHGFNLGGINGSGQVPFLPNLPQPIDPATPKEALTKRGLNGDVYNLVFSDEFNTDGRTFYPGDDPYWEAVDLYYWPTADLEWYSPDAITTKDGFLQITITEMPNHDLNFQSGMLQSWNKLCFTTGILEASISLPGDGVTPGFWPGFWSMGNLGRPGYGATTDGTWPYTYDSCDAGTLPNQTNPDGTPALTSTSGTDDKTDFKLSFLPGQRVSSCTCSSASIPNDHPGPFPGRGRGAPEIDVIEAQIDTENREGQASQSFQVAPFDAGYQFVNTTPATSIVDPLITKFNNFKGSVTQEAISGVSQIGTEAYGGNAFQKYGYEWWSNQKKRDEGFISWYVGDKTTWTMYPSSVGPVPEMQIGQRIIPEEPMVRPLRNILFYLLMKVNPERRFESGHVPRLPTRRFQKPQVPREATRRLRAHISEGWSRGWVDV